MQTKGCLPLDSGVFGVSSVAFITSLGQWCVFCLINQLPASKNIKLGNRAQVIIQCLGCAVTMLDQPVWV